MDAATHEGRLNLTQDLSSIFHIKSFEQAARGEARLSNTLIFLIIFLQTMKRINKQDGKERVSKERREEPAEITMGLPPAPGGSRGEREERGKNRVSK